MPKYREKCPPLREADLYTGCPFHCVYCIASSRHSEEVRPTDRERDIFASPVSSVPSISPHGLIHTLHARKSISEPVR